jgi:hypothetical protein
MNARLSPVKIMESARVPSASETGVINGQVCIEGVIIKMDFALNSFR